LGTPPVSKIPITAIGNGVRRSSSQIDPGAGQEQEPAQ
jgi:hypothetical protein